MDRKLGRKTKIKNHPPAHSPLPPEPREGHPRPPAPPHHDIPPHIFHEIMSMKDEIGKLKGKIEVIENILIRKSGDK